MRDGLAPIPLVSDRFSAPPEVRAFVQYGRTLPAFAAAFSLVCRIFRPPTWQPLTFGALVVRHIQLP
ncbi:hypothetical protein BBK82_23065 [Lentzea guizhouensis]|uniref:Uncharacterized protein n=1 Tax=Lentzea guizhouensis TaxID=1586287 RepID=A0A1B2HLD4_9PSEU|nr:hypothetical protein [Lentzea guizhouensis]ANZ38511.1 hypothetical protein BBK82_23065 [Lentzea guizhouensis]